MIHGTDYYPEQWLHRPDVIARDIELMGEAGINAVTLGVFAWSELEPEEGRYELGWLDEVITRCGAAGIKTILATPSAARPPWMAQRYPEVLRTLDDGRRARFGGRHNHCPHSSVYREKVTAIDEVLARQFGARDEVIYWHISNEYQGTCFCERCTAAFQGWLRQEHGDDLELLNQRWWSRFWGHRYTDWSQIEAPMTHGERNLHGQIIDWNRFVSASIADFARMEVAAVRRHDATTPTTHNFMGLHDSLNYVDLAREVDVIAGDIYPAWGLPPGSNDGMLHTVPEDGDVFGTYEFVLAWYRGISGGRPWLLMESTPATTNWHEVGRAKRPGGHALASLAAVAGGAASVQYFQWRQGRGGWEQFHGSVIDHEGSPGRTFGEVQGLSGLLRELEAVMGTRGDERGARAGATVADAALVLDTPSRWMIQQASGPRNDGRRGEVGTAIRHFDALRRAGFTVDVVPPEHLLEADTPWPYRLIVLPMVAHISEQMAARITDFVHGGGTVFVTYFTGLFDRWQRLVRGGYPAYLTELCGVRVVERDQLAAGERVPLVWAVSHGGDSADQGPEAYACEYCDIVEPSDDTAVVARYGGEFYEGSAAITRRSAELGVAWYLAGRVGTEVLTTLYREIAESCAVAAGLRALAGSLPPRVHWMTRAGTATGGNDGTGGNQATGVIWLFLFNPNDNETVVNLPTELNVATTPAPILSRASLATDSGRPGSPRPSVVTLHSWGCAVFPVHP